MPDQSASHDTSNSAKHPGLTVACGPFAALGLSGVSLARGAVVMGFHLGVPHPSIGLGDGLEVLYSLAEPPAWGEDGSSGSVVWRVPIDDAGVRRFATRPIAGVNGPRVIEYLPGEATLVRCDWVFDSGTVTSRYRAEAPVTAMLIAGGSFRPAVASATADGCRLVQDEAVLQVRCGTAPRFIADDARQIEQGWFGTAIPTGSGDAVFALDLAPGRDAWVTAALDGPAPPPEPAVCAARIAAAQAARAARSMRSGCGAAEAIASLNGYARTWDAPTGRVRTAVNRSWAGRRSPGPVFGWDNLVTSYLAAWDDPRLAAHSLAHIVGLYADRGIDHGPVQRNLIIPQLACRTLAVLGDAGLERRLWPGLLAFMRWWFAPGPRGVPNRDGNRSGLICLGTGLDPRQSTLGGLIQEAMDETGYDELPTYSAGFTNGRRGLLAPGVGFDRATQCLTVHDLGQNCLYIASCRWMAALGRRLGENADASWLESEAQRVADRVQHTLFDPGLGIYRDRRWDGSWSPVHSLTIFYPLLAGLGDAPTRARLRELLTDPAHFWTERLVPTVSRSDPSYRDGLDGSGNYWRGNCWPPTSWIVLQAVRAAGWDDLAAIMAQRLNAQFQLHWQAHVHAYENEPPEGPIDRRFLYLGGWGGREIRYTWAGLLPLAALEELAQPLPDGGLLLGRGPGSWSNLSWRGRRLDLSTEPGGVTVRLAGTTEALPAPGGVLAPWASQGSPARP